ncbi:MAG: hypothetical protein WKF61_06120 [Luteimonas sp.]
MLHSGNRLVHDLLAQIGGEPIQSLTLFSGECARYIGISQSESASRLPFNLSDSDLDYPRRRTNLRRFRQFRH